MNTKTRWTLGAFLLGVALDQATKAWARTLGPHDQVDIIPGWLAFVHARNKGAALSMLADSPYRLQLFAVFTVLTLIGLVLAWRSTEEDDHWTALTIGLFLAGAVGNGIDRVWRGEVTDFVKVYAGSGPLRTWAIETFDTNVYPIWNVADAALFVAVPLYLLTTVFRRDPPEPGNAADDAPLRDPLGPDEDTVQDEDGPRTQAAPPS